MSLKNIGELGDFASVLTKSPKVTPDWQNAFNTIRDSLDGLKIEEASKKLSDLKLDPNISKHILDEANRLNLLKGSAEEIAEGIKNFENAPSIIDNIGSSFDDIDDMFTGLGKSVKSGLSSITSFLSANPYVTFALVAVAAITAVVVAFDAAIETYDEANEKAKKSAKAYQDAQNAVESLRSELETTKERLKELQELQDAGTITVVEEKELANLKIKNEELERELKIKEKLAELQLQDANDDAINALGKKDASVATMYDDEGNKYAKGSKIYDANVSSLTDADALEKSMKKVEAYETKIANLKQKQEKALDQDEYDNIQKKIDKYENAISDLETDMNTKAQNISDHLKNVSDKTSAVYIENSRTLNKYLNHDLLSPFKFQNIRR